MKFVFKSRHYGKSKIKIKTSQQRHCGFIGSSCFRISTWLRFELRHKYFKIITCDVDVKEGEQKRH